MFNAAKVSRHQELEDRDAIAAQSADRLAATWGVALVLFNGSSDVVCQTVANRSLHVAGVALAMSGMCYLRSLPDIPDMHISHISLDKLLTGI